MCPVLLVGDRDLEKLLLQLLVAAELYEAGEQHGGGDERINVFSHDSLFPGGVEELGDRGERFEKGSFEELPQEFLFKNVFAVNDVADGIVVHVAEKELLHPETELG